MIRWLADTNVWSELDKRRPDAGVVQWYAGARAEVAMHWLSVGEMRRGWFLRPAEPDRRRAGLDRVDELVERLLAADMIYGFGMEESWGWARWGTQPEVHSPGRTLKQKGADAVIAATAYTHNLQVATHNTTDFPGRLRDGRPLAFNPWKD